MKQHPIQTNFTSGELDPRMASRIDVQQYYNGAERLRNVIVNHLGGAVRCPGMQHIDVLDPLVLALENSVTATAPNGGTAANGLDDDFNTKVTTTGNIGTTNPYVVLHYDLGADVDIRSAEIIGASTDVSTADSDDTGLRKVNKSSNDASVGDKPWDAPNGSNLGAVQLGFDASNNQSYYLRCMNPNVSRLIPADATIVGVQAQITKKKGSTSFDQNIEDAQVRLVVKGVIVGNNKAAAGDWLGSFFTTTYGGAADLWGYSLTRELVVRSDFGIAISARTNEVIGSAYAVVQSVKIKIYYSTAVTASPSEFRIQYSTDDAAWNNYGDAFQVRDNDEVSFRHTEVVTARYWRYARIGATNLGTAKAIVRNFNVFADTTSFASTGGLSDCAFVDFDFSLDQRYMIVFTDRNAAVYENGILQTNLPTPYTSDMLGLLRWDQRLDTVALFHPDVPPQIMQRQGRADRWVLKAMVFDYIPKYAFNLVVTNPNQTLTPSAVTGSILLTAGGSTFVAGDVGQYVRGNGGVARIYEYTSGTVVKARVEIPFRDSSAIPAGSWKLERGYEAAWSTTRGWPNCGLFYQGRLWIGGARSLPDTIWGSRLSLFFDFDPGRADADDAIEATLENRDVSGILNIAAANHLLFFTKTAEFYIPQAPNEPLTPSNFLPRKADNKGSRTGTNVVNADGVTIFVQTEGASIQKLKLADGTTQTDENSIYAAEDISGLSAHLIVTPVQIAFRKATGPDDPNLLLVVNSDGTLAICTLEQKQGIQAWTLRSTNGLVKRVGVIGNEIYLMVERTIDGVAKRFIERFNNNCTLDGAVFVEVDEPVTLVTDLEDIFGSEEVQIILDDAYQNPQSVEGGELTFDREAAVNYQIGFGFDPLIRPMPVARNPDGGAVLRGKKRVSEVLLFLYKTRWAEINGQPVGLQQYGAAPSPLDNTLQPFTGHKTVDGLLGWSEEGQFDITQGGIPVSMTITGIEMKVRL